MYTQHKHEPAEVGTSGQQATICRSLTTVRSSGRHSVWLDHLEGAQYG